MTSEELKKNWKQYALKMDDDGKTTLLKDMYSGIWGIYVSGLCFILKDQPGDCDLLRPDGDDSCYAKLSLNGELLKGWVLVGKFVKLKPSKKKRRKK